MTNQQRSLTLGCGIVAVAVVFGLLIVAGAILLAQQLAAPASAPPQNQPVPSAPQPQAAQPQATAVVMPQAPAGSSSGAATNPPSQPAVALPPEAPTPIPLPGVFEAGNPQATAQPQAQAAPQQALPTYTPAATFTPFPTYTPLPTPTQTPSPTPLPVVDWQRSGTLNVLDWTTTIVIEKEIKKEGVAAIIPGRDRVVLVVTGKLRAGVDLTRVQPQNVQINGTSIHIVVPRPTLTSVELMPEESRVYDAERSWLFSEYTGLELAAMEEAKAKLAGPNPTNTRMLETAEAVARLQLTNFLRDLGFQKVEVVFAR